MIWIPTIELIEIIYEKQIRIPVQYVNKQHLESALDTLKWGFPFQKTELSIWGKAAILIRNIVQFHVFADGCKRIGIHTDHILNLHNVS
ncbi:MAG: Fic family protein [Promethearchaeota archaeon]